MHTVCSVVRPPYIDVVLGLVVAVSPDRHGSTERL